MLRLGLRAWIHPECSPRRVRLVITAAVPLLGCILTCLWVLTAGCPAALAGLCSMDVVMASIAMSAQCLTCCACCPQVNDSGEVLDLLMDPDGRQVGRHQCLPCSAGRVFLDTAANALGCCRSATDGHRLHPYVLHMRNSAQTYALRNSGRHTYCVYANLHAVRLSVARGNGALQPFSLIAVLHKCGYC
jgi:hypothetical protein